MTAMKRKGTQRNRGIILGYFSNLAVEVCPADRPDDSYPSAERQLLQRLEDLRERCIGTEPLTVKTAFDMSCRSIYAIFIRWNRQ